MPRKPERTVLIPIRLAPDLSAKVDEFVQEGGWPSRNAMLKSIIENVIHESNSHEDILT